MLVFCVVWMAVLPIGVKMEKSPQRGNAASAPEKAYLGRKFIAAFFISVSITAALMWWNVMTFFVLWALQR
jgi:predicted secreted protein